MDLRTSSKLFLIQHSQTGFYNRGRECLARYGLNPYINTDTFHL